MEAMFQIVERQKSLGDRFTDLQRQGAGYFSLVVKARDSLGGNQVALKFFNPLIRLAGNGSEYRFDCFSREARILEELKGERDIIGWVSPIAEFEETLTAGGGIPIPAKFSYFGLELAETDLEAAIMNTCLGPEEVLEGFHVMCRAVRRLHSRGYVHRDLKPSNFVILPDGSIKMADLGTARRISQRENPLSPVYVLPPGDKRYAAPEAMGCLLDDDCTVAYAADVFALGAILFEMITGTILGLQVFDERFRSQLLNDMVAVPRGQRKARFNEIVGAITDNHPLPNLAAFAPDFPRSILPLVDELYKAMACLDYRKRLMDFDRIFLRLRSALVVLRNEEKYQRWRQRQKLIRQARQQKLIRLGWAAPIRNGVLK